MIFVFFSFYQTQFITVFLWHGLFLSPYLHVLFMVTLNPEISQTARVFLTVKKKEERDETLSAVSDSNSIKD